MKKAKTITARKTLSKKVSGQRNSKTGSPLKAKIQVKTKVESPVKRKAARRPEISTLANENSRGVIPDSEKRDRKINLTNDLHPKEAIPRKVAGKKPIFPLGHSD